jgi:hypothetical protein
LCWTVFLAEKDKERFAVFARKAALDERAQELQAELNDTLLGNFHKECKARVAVMQKLGFLGEDGTVLLKGRAASEVDTTDELLATGEGGRKGRPEAGEAVACVCQVWGLYGHRRDEGLRGRGFDTQQRRHASEAPSSEGLKCS